MQFEKAAIALLTDDVSASRRFWVDHFGFTAVVELDWYVSLHHPDHPAYVLDVVHREHESLPAALRGRPTSGVSLAFVVADVASAHEELITAGVQVLAPPTDMPWGQRRFHVVSPENVVLEVVQFTAPDPDWLAAHAG